VPPEGSVRFSQRLTNRGFAVRRAQGSRFRVVSAWAFIVLGVGGACVERNISSPLVWMTVVLPASAAAPGSLRHAI
jgi:hypothetical protein